MRASECPLIVGRGEGEQFVASAVPAFLAQTRRVQYLENDEIVVLRPDGVTITTRRRRGAQRAVETVDWDEETAEKGGYETFMLKEIHEQADAVADTISDRTAARGWRGSRRGGRARRGDARGRAADRDRRLRHLLPRWPDRPLRDRGVGARCPWRWTSPRSTATATRCVGPGDLVIGISQSGETADTLAAMRMARERGATVLAITNVMGSQATRDADGVLFTRAGLEIGVAATKTFLCQVAVMYLLGLRLAELRGTLPPERVTELVSELKRLPHCIAELTGQARAADGRRRSAGRAVATLLASEFFLYIGRHVGLPVALEGALKLKEISYIATDAYAAGEMKHGPIALLDEATPVVCVATDSPVLEKMASNMQEVRARGAHVIAVAPRATSGSHSTPTASSTCPAVDWMLQPILAVIPLQLLAYEIARRRGLNVDQPRNLAKTVTVE